MYDSLFSIVEDEVHEQVKCLVGEELFKEINIINVQQQKNSFDCGVYVIMRRFVISRIASFAQAVWQ